MLEKPEVWHLMLWLDDCGRQPPCAEDWRLHIVVIITSVHQQWGIHVNIRFFLYPPLTTTHQCVSKKLPCSLWRKCNYLQLQWSIDCVTGHVAWVSRWSDVNRIILRGWQQTIGDSYTCRATTPSRLLSNNYIITVSRVRYRSTPPIAMALRYS